MVNRIVTRRASTEVWEQAEEWLVLWRDNDAQLQPLLPKSQLTQELAPVSTNLVQLYKALGGGWDNPAPVPLDAEKGLQAKL